MAAGSDAAAVAAATAPGFGDEQATHSFLSGALPTSHTEQTHVPGLGLNRSISDGCAASEVFFSSGFGFSAASGLAPKPKLGFAAASELAPKANDGFGGAAAAGAGELVLPNAKPVLAGSVESAFLPKENPEAAAAAPKVKPVAAGFGAGFAPLAGSGDVKEKLGAVEPPTLEKGFLEANQIFCSSICNQ